MPTRFCLKKNGEPSSIKIRNATARKTGDNIIRTSSANNRLSIGRK